MTRRCNGEDPNLMQIVDEDGNRVRRPTARTTEKPCDCGLVFDDVRREVVWPHPLV